MLYILTQSPFVYKYKFLFKMITNLDEVLFIQNGVLICLQKKKIDFLIKKSIKIFVLYEDIYSRGLIKKIDDRIFILDYNKFVDLTIKHINQITF